MQPVLKPSLEKESMTMATQKKTLKIVILGDAGYVLAMSLYARR